MATKNQITNAQREAAQAEASKDSILFSDEFPGEELSGDWDATAWSMAPDELRSVDGLFEHYRSHLIECVRLNNHSLRAQEP